MTFNNFSMSFPNNYSDVPVLFQSPSNNTDCCGVVCGLDTGCRSQLPGRCGSYPPTKECDCQHVIQQPWLPGKPVKYWFEIILINVKEKGNKEKA